MLNEAPRHESIRLSGGIAPRILSFMYRMLYPLGKNPRGTYCTGGWVVR